MQPNESVKLDAQRRYAYVSSTQDDLQEYRNRVAQELRQAGYELIGREKYGAESNRSLRHRLADVAACDVFVGLVAMHYGDILTPDEFTDLPPLAGIRVGESSFTECEYRQALAAGRQVFMFLLDEDSPWPPSQQDFRTGHGDRGNYLLAWRDLIRREGYDSKRPVSFFKSLDDLGTEVRKLVAARPAAGQLADADQAAPWPQHNLPPPMPAELVGRQSQLRQLAQALRGERSLICVEGPAGAGRTRLAQAAGYAYRQPGPGEKAQHYVVWLAADPKAEEDQQLSELLTLIAQVAGRMGLAGQTDREKKEQGVLNLLCQHRFLLIADDFDQLKSPKLKAWLLDPALPAHVLLVLESAARQQLPLPPTCLITLAPLSVEDTLAHLALLGISEAATPGATPEALRELALYTKGEFRVIGLLVPQLKERLKKGADFREALAEVLRPEEKDKIQGLHQRGWAGLPPAARQLLRTTALFANPGAINWEALLAACGLPRAEFETAQAQLRESKLLELLTRDNGTSFYTVDADTYLFAQKKLRRRPEFEMAARRRWGEFYHEFVERCMRRTEPDVPYWCSLVSNSMEALDAEWPAVLAVLDWADQHRNDQLLLTLVLLLMHYMDSRMLNKERLNYASRGARAARRLRRPYEEALLRIDALGWTYFDENCPHKALEEIGRGLGLIKPLGETSQDAWELFQLGLAWQARVKMEIALLIDRAQPGRLLPPPAEASALASVSPYEAKLLHKEAVHLIEKALRANCSPWIRYRILKAAGDIAFKARISLRQLKEDREALDLYRQAEQEVAKYGGEGASYQIGPRIGLAYLRRNSQPADDPSRSDVAKAAKRFNKLCKNPHLPITGMLYGKYGKALIEKQAGRTEAAQQELDSLEKELRQHTSSNQLLKLVMSFDEPAPPG